MREGMGHVKFNERNADDGFQRFVDERVRDWMRTHGLASSVGSGTDGSALDGASADYEVTFFDEEVLGEISCLIVVQNGRDLWRSWETGDTAHEAFDLSLENLHSDLQQ